MTPRDSTGLGSRRLAIGCGIMLGVGGKKRCQEPFIDSVDLYRVRNAAEDAAAGGAGPGSWICVKFRRIPQNLPQIGLNSAKNDHCYLRQSDPILRLIPL